MFDVLNSFIVGLLMVLASQYNYDYFSPLIVILYSIFFPGFSNILFVLFLAIIIFLKFGEVTQLWWIVFGVILFIIFVSAIFGKKPQQEDGGGYEDLLKMLGNGQQ